MANYSWNSIFGRDPNLRAADADRETTAERIRRSHSEGRLDTDELQQRLERCYQAKTVGELDELVTDLPPQEQPSPGYSARQFGPWRRRLFPLAPLLFALVVVCVVTGHHALWFLIPLAFLYWKFCWWRWRPWHTTGRGQPDHWV